MKNFNADAFRNSTKRNNKLLIVGIIFLILTILLVYLGITNENKKLPPLESLSDLIKNKIYQEDKYAYVDIVTKPALFAVYEVDGKEEKAKYYFAMDRENHLYIIYMDENKYNELNVDNISETPKRITGLTKKIPNDIKDLAVDSYNELLNEEYLTKDNFKDYVGPIYLDIYSPINDSSLYYIGAVLTGFFFLLMIIIYIVIILKNKKLFKKIEDSELANIDAEISGMKNSKYDNMKFYLLKEYLVDTSNNIVILKYSDIVWAYPFEQRYNGLLINKCIKIVDNNNRKYDVANTKLLEKNKDNILQDILNELSEKNEKIILGYTEENKKMAKEKIKELKNK